MNINRLESFNEEKITEGKNEEQESVTSLCKIVNKIIDRYDEGKLNMNLIGKK